MPTRNAEAVWEGDLKGGKGTMSLGSGAYQGAYSFPSRFESGAGTNPEELIAAAHAGCFSMALSHDLAQAGHPPKRVQTTAKVHLDKLAGRLAIPRSRRVGRAEVAGAGRGGVPGAGRAGEAELPGVQALGRGRDHPVRPAGGRLTRPVGRLERGPSADWWTSVNAAWPG